MSLWIFQEIEDYDKPINEIKIENIYSNLNEKIPSHGQTKGRNTEIRKTKHQDGQGSKLDS